MVKYQPGKFSILMSENDGKNCRKNESFVESGLNESIHWMRTNQQVYTNDDDERVFSSLEEPLKSEKTSEEDVNSAA